MASTRALRVLSLIIKNIFYNYSLNVAENCHFAKTHEWVSLEGDIATIGISDHAQDSLGEAVYVDLPDVGTEFSQGGNTSFNLFN